MTSESRSNAQEDDEEKEHEDEHAEGDVSVGVTLREAICSVQGESQTPAQVRVFYLKQWFF